MRLAQPPSPAEAEALAGSIRARTGVDKPGAAM